MKNMTISIHQKIIDELINEQKKDSSTMGMLIFGSVGQGREKPDSDIDVLMVLSKGEKSDFIQEKKYGIKIDFVIWPKDKLIERQTKYPFLSYSFSEGRIVYDSTLFMKELMDKINAYFDDHKDVVEFWKSKKRAMETAKEKGVEPESPREIYDEAEIKFSKEHKVTRGFYTKTS